MKILVLRSGHRVSTKPLKYIGRDEDLAATDALEESLKEKS